MQLSTISFCRDNGILSFSNTIPGASISIRFGLAHSVYIRSTLVQVAFKGRGAYVDGLKRGEGFWRGGGLWSGRGGWRREIDRIKRAPSFLPLLSLCFLFLGGRGVLWRRRFGFGCTNPLVSRCRTAGLGNGSSVVCDLHSLVACVVSLHCGCLTKPQVGGDTPSRSMLLRLRQKIKKGDLRKKDSTLKSC